MDVFMVWTILFFSWEPFAQGKEWGGSKVPPDWQKALTQCLSLSTLVIHKPESHFNLLVTIFFHCFPIIRRKSWRGTNLTWICNFISKILTCNTPSIHVLFGRITAMWIALTNLKDKGFQVTEIKRVAESIMLFPSHSCWEECVPIYFFMWRIYMLWVELNTIPLKK